jgi:hypothetical protein
VTKWSAPSWMNHLCQAMREQDGFHTYTSPNPRTLQSQGGFWKGEHGEKRGKDLRLPQPTCSPPFQPEQLIFLWSHVSGRKHHDSFHMSEASRTVVRQTALCLSDVCPQLLGTDVGQGEPWTCVPWKLLSSNARLWDAAH